MKTTFFGEVQMPPFGEIPGSGFGEVPFPPFGEIPGGFFGENPGFGEVSTPGSK